MKIFFLGATITVWLCFLSKFVESGHMCGVGVSCKGILYSVSLSDGCNNCWCSVSKNGTFTDMGCTKMFCEGGDPAEKEAFCKDVHKKNNETVELAKSGPFMCGIKVSCEGVKYKVDLTDGCNKCLCGVGRGGRAYGPECTKKHCGEGSGDKETFCKLIHERNRKAVELSKAGPFKCGIKESCEGIKRKVYLIDGCNECSCSVGKDGRATGPTCKEKPCGPGYGDKEAYCKRIHERNKKAIEAAKRELLMCDIKVSCEGIKRPVRLTDGCNTCWCGVGKGGHASKPACTLMRCPRFGDKKAFCKRIHENNRKAVELAKSGPFMCGIKVSCKGIKRNVSLSDGCNGCSCSVDEDGHAVGPKCATKFCEGGSGDKKAFCRYIHRENKKAIKAAKQDRLMCDIKVSCEGVKYKVYLTDGCNECWCGVGRGGRAIGPKCTKKLCPRFGNKKAFCKRIHKKNKRAVERAKAGPFKCGIKVSCKGIKRKVYLSDGCNECSCSVGEDGRATEPTCKEKPCGPGYGDKKAYCKRIHKRNKRAIKAAKRERLMCDIKVSCEGIKRPARLTDGCNTCWCSGGKDGRTVVACTKMLCPQFGNKKAFCKRIHEKNKKAVELAKSGPFMCGLKVSCEGIKRRVYLSDGCNSCLCFANFFMGPYCTGLPCGGGSGDKKAFCKYIHEENQKAVKLASR